MNGCFESLVLSTSDRTTPFWRNKRLRGLLHPTLLEATKAHHPIQYFSHSRHSYLPNSTLQNKARDRSLALAYDPRVWVCVEDVIIPGIYDEVSASSSTHTHAHTLSSPSSSPSSRCQLRRLQFIRHPLQPAGRTGPCALSREERAAAGSGWRCGGTEASNVITSAAGKWMRCSRKWHWRPTGRLLGFEVAVTGLGAAWAYGYGLPYLW